MQHFLKPSKLQMVFSVFYVDQIMNCIRSMTSTLLLILLGIQAVSHSQYYSSNDQGSYRYPLSSSISTIKIENGGNNYFNTRNYQPPYRQHQHYYHYSNDPSQETPEGMTTVKYFGTNHEPSRQIYRTHTTERYDNVEPFTPRDFGNSHHSPETSASYRRRYNGYQGHPQDSVQSQFDYPGVGVGMVSNREYNGQMNIHHIGNADRPREIIRVIIPSSRSFKQPESNEYATNVEKPPPVDDGPEVPYPPPCNVSERIHPADGWCYTLGTRGRCKPEMILFPEGGNSRRYGECDCDYSNGKVWRPLVRWPPTDKCYLLFGRGPCHYSEWLILDRNGLVTCAPRSCSEDVDDDGPRFWFLHEGKCYKTGQHYPRFCGPGREDWNVWFNYTEPTCLKEMPHPLSRTLVAGVGQLPCRPGYKKLLNGECKRVARFDDDY